MIEEVAFSILPAAFSILTDDLSILFAALSTLSAALSTFFSEDLTDSAYSETLAEAFSISFEAYFSESFLSDFF